MKFYNDFSSMFNAQFGLKKDMSVFNTVDDWGDCFAIEPYHDAFVDRWCLVYYVDDDSATSVYDGFDRCSAVNFAGPLKVYSSLNDGVCDIVRRFGKDIGLEYDPYKDSTHRVYPAHHDGPKDIMGRYIVLPRYLTKGEARELADRLDSFLSRKYDLINPVEYDLTNPIKEKFWMPVD